MVVACACALLPRLLLASDHLDSSSVIADPRADIGDVYAWMSPDGERLNLVMTIVGHAFSDRLDYVFHVDSGKRFGKTSATTTIVCRFPKPDTTDCHVDDVERALGDAGKPEGLVGSEHGFRVFAGLRDDPFFNNVRGTRAAYQVAIAALRGGATMDSASCPRFDRTTANEILYQWRHTDGGPGTNFLAGWTPASIVVSIDRRLVAKDGNLLAVWGATVDAGKQIDRAGRPLTGNALLGTIASADESDRLKEQYNAATPAASAGFVPEIEKGLALYDGLDGVCGNQLLANAAPPQRYFALASLLADDRLWVNSASPTCTQLFAVELAHLAGQSGLRDDCGGRTPNYDAVDTYRSLLVNGTPNGVDDGVRRDEREHSTRLFPFLAPPSVVTSGTNASPRSAR